jgi:hypothetical protein
MTDLASIAEVLRERGFPRQAVLLECPKGAIYAQALIQGDWEERIREALGDDVYAALQAVVSDPVDWGFEVAEIDEPFEPLEIEVENKLDLGVLREADRIFESLVELCNRGDNLVHTAAQEILGSDEEKIFQVWKDADVVHEDRERVDRKLIRRDLERDVERMRKVLPIMHVPVIIFQEYRRALRRAPVLPFPAGFREMVAAVTSDPDEPKIGEYEDEIRAFREPLVEMAKQLLSSRDLLEPYIDPIIDDLQSSHRGRVIARGLRWLPAVSTIENVFTDQNIEYGKEYVELDQGISMNEQKGLEGVLKQPIEFRRWFHDIDIGHVMRQTRAIHSGLVHLVEGGEVTNPEAHETSICQNHGGYPNLKYPESVLNELKTIAAETGQFLKDLPSLEDMVVPRRLRNRKSLRFAVRELPKDPLDVTFGNDGACCVAVSTKLKDLINGFSVPSFLLEPCVRLFGVYRLDVNTEKRVGFVLTFETRDARQVYRLNRYETAEQKLLSMIFEPSNNRLMLSCNSLELSRTGLAGGRATVEKLVEYVESWFVHYAQTHGFDGVMMGGHGYNTSVNYRRKDAQQVLVEEPYACEVKGTHPFFSDIFTGRYKEADETVSQCTRPGKCYWLWRAEGEE